MNDLVEARNLTKKINSDFTVKSISLNVGLGECLGVIGPINSGKSSILSMLSCQTAFDSGQLFIDKLDVQESKAKVKSLIGVVSQNNDLDKSLSPYLNLLTYSLYFGIPVREANRAIKSIFRELEIDENSDLLFSDVDTIQKVSLARALVTSPKVLFMDEFFFGVGGKAKSFLKNHLLKIKNKNNVAQILFTSDFLQVDSLIDKIIVISNGKIIAQGPPNQLILENVGKEVVEFQISGTDVSYYLEKLKPNYEYKITNDKVRLFLKSGQHHGDALKLLTSENIVIRKATIEDLYVKVSEKSYEAIPR